MQLTKYRLAPQTTTLYLRMSVAEKPIFSRLVNGKLVSGVGNRILVNDRTADSVSETEFRPQLGTVTKLDWYKETDEICFLVITTTSGFFLAKLDGSKLTVVAEFEHQPVYTEFLGPPLRGIYIEFEVASYIIGLGCPNAVYSTVFSPPQFVLTDKGPQWVVHHRIDYDDSSTLSLWPSNCTVAVIDDFDIDKLQFSLTGLFFAYTDKYTFDLHLGAVQTQELAVQRNIAPEKFEWTRNNLLLVLHEDKQRYEAQYEINKTEMRYRTEPEFGTNKVLSLTVFDYMLNHVQCLSGIKACSHYEMSAEYTLTSTNELVLVANNLISFSVSENQLFSVNERFVCLWKIGRTVALVYAVRIDLVPDSVRVEFNETRCLVIRWPAHTLLMPSTGPVLRASS